MSALDQLNNIPRPHITPVPAVEASPNKLAEAMENYLLMERMLADAQAEVRRLTAANVDLANEGHMLRDQLKTMTSNFLSVQAYATGLNTRMDVCIAVMAEAKSEASKFAVKALEAKRDDGVSDADSGALRGILDRLAPVTLNAKAG